MFEFVNVLLTISIFQNLFLICICMITVAAINLCAKKRGSGRATTSKKSAVNVTSIKATPSKKSLRQVSPKSPIAGAAAPGAAPGTPLKKSPDENAADKNDNKAKPASVEKSLKEGSVKKTAGGDGKDVTEDSFEAHKPVAREAKRTEEIKKRGYVDQKRKDYKTLRNDLPSSDFDKSLGLPETEENNNNKKK